MYWRFKSCTRCSGDLVLDDDEWQCMQCGHYYYPKIVLPIHDLPHLEAALAGGASRRKARTPPGGIAGRNINAMITGDRIRTERWRERNRQIISYIDEGKSVSEIAGLTTLDKRQISQVRQTLKELRAQASVQVPNG